MGDGDGRGAGTEKRLLVTCWRCKCGVSIPPEVRRWIGEWHKSHPQAASDGTAVAFGANPVVSTLLRLINSGVRLLGISSGDLVFARNEADAWVVIAQRRKLWRERVLARRAAAAGPR